MPPAQGISCGGVFGDGHISFGIMKPLIWILFALLSLLWTGVAWLLARPSDWLVQLVAAAGKVAWVDRVAESPPLLLQAGWLDADLCQWLQDARVGLLQSLEALLPLLGSALDRQAPFIWLIWGVGMLLLLLLLGRVTTSLPLSSAPPPEH